MPRDPFFVVTGAELGQLTIGEVIHLKTQAPRGTPASYFDQGELRLCTCSCGAQVAYPAAVLKRGTIKSCGCLRVKKSANRSEIRAKAAQRKAWRQKIKALKHELLHRTVESAQPIWSEIHYLNREIKKSLGKPGYVRVILGPGGVPL